MTAGRIVDSLLPRTRVQMARGHMNLGRLGIALGGKVGSSGVNLPDDATQNEGPNARCAPTAYGIAARKDWSSVVVSLLHLSDVHRTPDDPAKNADILAGLYRDLDSLALEEPRIPFPDILIVSGDLTQSASEKEYDEARALLTAIAGHCGLTHKRIVVVPGNHDVHWPTSRKVSAAMRGVGSRKRGLTNAPATVKAERNYQKRLDNFRTFYRSLTGELYPDDRKRAYTLHRFDDLEVAVAAFSSVDENDHIRRGGQIYADSIHAAAEALEFYPGHRVAVWHHDLNWTGDRAQDCLDPKTLGQLSAQTFELGLCGHYHRPAHHNAAHLGAYGLPVVAAGSLCAGQRQRGMTPCSYNLVCLDNDIARVYTRERDELQPHWHGKLHSITGRAALSYQEIALASPPPPKTARKSWKFVLQGLKKLNDHIVQSGFKPDFIVSWSDGGLVLADLLHIRHMPQVPVVSCILTRSGFDGGELRRNVEFVYPPRDFFRNKKVLLVDDVVNSAASMEVAAKFYFSSDQRQRRKHVRLAVLGKSAVTPVKLDFAYFEYTGECILPYAKVPRSLPGSAPTLVPRSLPGGARTP